MLARGRAVTIISSVLIAALSAVCSGGDVPAWTMQRHAFWQKLRGISCRTRWHCTSGLKASSLCCIGPRVYSDGFHWCSGRGGAMLSCGGQYHGRFDSQCGSCRALSVVSSTVCGTSQLRLRTLAGPSCETSWLLYNSVSLHFAVDPAAFTPNCTIPLNSGGSTPC